MKEDCPVTVSMADLDILGADEEEVIDEEIEQAILDEGFLTDSFLVWIHILRCILLISFY